MLIRSHVRSEGTLPHRNVAADTVYGSGRSLGAVGTGSRLRVCIVAPSLAILGGQAVQADRLVEQLRRLAAVDIEFLPVNPRLPTALRWLQRIKYVRTVATSLLYVVLLLSRLHRYDVIHIFSASYWSFLLAPLPAVLIARLHGKKVALNYHSGEARDHLNRWGWLVIPAIRLAHRVIVPSGYLVDVFEAFGIKAEPVPNFVDVERLPYHSRRQVTPHFLCNRNFEANYNVSCVLRAFARIQSQHPEAQLTLVGEGSERLALLELTRSLQLRNVEFVGAIPPDQMGRFLDAADVYLNSSRVDNMPLSILEAFAAGLPVVSTNAGGIPYIVEHRRNGLLVPCDDHEALAREAMRLLEDPELVAKLTSAARSDCLEEYTWRAVGAQWEACYWKVAARTPVRSLAR